MHPNGMDADVDIEIQRVTNLVGSQVEYDRHTDADGNRVAYIDAGIVVCRPSVPGAYLLVDYRAVKSFAS